MEAFALRQSNDYTGLNHIDNIVIGHTYADVTSLVTTGGTGSPTSVGTPVIGTAGGEPLTGNLAFTLTGSSLVPAGNPNMFGTIVVLGFGSLTAGTPIPGAPVGAIQYVNSSTSSFLLADGAGTVNLSLGIPSSTTLCGLSVSAQLGDFDTSLATILKVGTSAGLTFRVSN